MPSEPIPVDPLADFYITYETTWLSSDYGTLLDTKRNIIGKPLGKDFAYADYCLPVANLQTLYDAVVEYDIKSYSSPDLITIEDTTVSPQIYFRITIGLNGEVTQCTLTAR